MVGSYDPYNIKAEMFNYGKGSWTTALDYPLASGSGFGYYDIIYLPERTAYYVIGGTDGTFLATIAMFKNGAWSEAGHLNTARTVSFCSVFFLFQNY